MLGIEEVVCEFGRHATLLLGRGLGEVFVGLGWMNKATLWLHSGARQEDRVIAHRRDSRLGGRMVIGLLNRERAGVLAQTLQGALACRVGGVLGGDEEALRVLVGGGVEDLFGARFQF